MRLSHLLKLIVPMAFIFYLSACIKTIDQFSSRIDEPITLEVGTINFNPLAQSIAGTFEHSVLNLPDTSTIGMTSIEVRIYDGFGSFADIIVPIEIINSVAPTIRLVGSSTITLEVSSVWVEPGLQVTDQIQGTYILNEALLQERNLYVNSLSTEVLGRYVFTYQIIDETGNLSNQITRTIDVVDSIPPQVIFPGFTRVFQGSPISLDDVRVLDNYDELTISDVFVDWRTMNPNNPTVGEYQVVLRVADRSNNVTVQTRTYKVIHTPTSLFQLIDTLTESGNFNAISTLFEEYKRYPEFNQSLLSQREQEFILNKRDSLMEEYFQLIDHQTNQQSIEYLIGVRSFLDRSFLETEVAQLVNKHVTFEQRNGHYEAAVHFIHRYQDYLAANQYRSMMRQGLSFMTNATTLSTRTIHRNTLESYAEVIGGRGNINYITYSKAISVNAFNEHWNRGVIQEAIRVIQEERNNSYISISDADTLVQQSMTRRMNQMFDQEQTQAQVTAFAQSVNYDFTTISPTWFESFILNLYRQ